MVSLSSAHVVLVSSPFQDRRKLTVVDIIQRSPQMDLAPGPRTSKETAQAYVGSSAKIEELVQLLSHIPHNEKSLVFSQFTSFLDKIAEALESERCAAIYHDLNGLFSSD